MSDALNLGCGTDIKPHMTNVDKTNLPGVDVVQDLNTYPWDLPQESYSQIRAEHVVEHLDDVERALTEMKRYLADDGKIVIVVPVGQNAIADPDHKHLWIWDTPEYYCGKRHWDVDVNLQVVGRSVSLITHLNGVSGIFVKTSTTLYKKLHGQGRWMFDVPFTSGEFTVVFEHDSR